MKSQRQRSSEQPNGSAARIRIARSERRRTRSLTKRSPSARTGRSGAGGSGLVRARPLPLTLPFAFRIELRRGWRWLRQRGCSEAALRVVPQPCLPEVLSEDVEELGEALVRERTLGGSGTDLQMLSADPHDIPFGQVRRKVE